MSLFSFLKKPNGPTSNVRRVIPKPNFYQIPIHNLLYYLLLFFVFFYCSYFSPEELWDKSLWWCFCFFCFFFFFFEKKTRGLLKSVRTLKKLKRHCVEYPAVTFLQKIEKEETCKFSISALFLIFGFSRNNFFS